MTQLAVEERAKLRKLAPSTVRSERAPDRTVVVEKVALPAVDTQCEAAATTPHSAPQAKIGVATYTVQSWTGQLPWIHDTEPAPCTSTSSVTSRAARPILVKVTVQTPEVRRPGW